MVRVEIIQADTEQPLAVVTAIGESLHIEGPRADLIEEDVPALGLPSGRRLESPHDDPEEWARGLLVSFRSPDRFARIVHDDDPLPPPSVNAPRIRRPLTA
jgi:hypothetical protein